MKKIKICVVTFFKHNYGAFLQAYALQQSLMRLGFDAEVLDYDYAKDKTFLGVPYKGRKNPISFFKALSYRLLVRSVSRKKDALFQKSAEEHIKQTKYYKTYEAVLADPPQADIYITGSDQVWNPFMAPQGLDSRLLTFADPERSVLCSYAASMGILYLNGESKNKFQKHLKNFDLISVREARSCVTLDGVTDKHIEVNKDPALLLDRSGWDAFAAPYGTEKDYVFLYLAQRDDALVEYARDIAKKNGWAIIDCHASVKYSIDCLNGGDILSPMEFVGSIKNAKYIVTNSFHCLVFTIHYKKCAYVKLPPKGSARLSELIEAMNLQRLASPDQMTDGEIEDTYKDTEAYLHEQRERAKNYIERAARIYENKNTVDR